MAYLSYSTPSSTKFTLIGPTGIVAVLNDGADANYVGDTTEVTGLDSPEVRESAEDNVEADGGSHDNFYYGRRPVVFTGNIKGHTTLAARAIKEDRLRRATNALRGDALVQWTVPSGAAVQLSARLQVPFRLTGGWLKEFQVGIVSASHLIESQALKTVSATAGAALPQSVVAENQGSVAALPELIQITGPVTNPIVVNTTTGQTIIKLNATIPDAIVYTINVKAHTVFEGTTNRYSTVDFITSLWAGLASGNNTLQLQGTGGGAATKLRVDWRDAWV